MKKLLLLNWKHHWIDDLEGYAQLVKGLHHIFIAPPHPLLGILQHYLPGQVIAQHADAVPLGSYTGSVGPQLLAKMKIRYSLLGHYETRCAGLTQSAIEATYAECLNANITPILCCGAPEPDLMQVFVAEQLSFLINKPLLNRVIIAYEPWWAVGRPDLVCDDEHLFQAYSFIRELLPLNTEVEFLYGGGLTLTNLSLMLKKPYIKGVLLGKISLNKEDIVRLIAISQDIISAEALS